MAIVNANKVIKIICRGNKVEYLIKEKLENSQVFDKYNIEISFSTNCTIKFYTEIGGNQFGIGIYCAYQITLTLN